MYNNFLRRSLPFVLTLLATYTLAQTTPDAPRPNAARIVVLGRAYGDSIVLRWGPSAPVAWQQLNQVGYLVERSTIIRDGQLLDVPERRLLSPDPIRPRPLPDWESVVEQDKYAAIAAQALYGQTFDVGSSSRSDIVQMINQAKELEQRFSFALFSADISPTAAQYAGLRFTDREVKPNEKYLYKVFPAAPVSVVPDTALVFLSANERTELPQPVEVTATFEDRRVMLRWNKYYHQSTYVAYRVERSEDGTTFAPITDLPITFTRSAGQSDDHHGYKSDSLPDNSTTFYYRVRGITPFGETGPPSQVVSGQGYRALRTPPAIVRAEAASGTAFIEWKIDKVAAPLVEHFSVEKAAAVSGPYQTTAASLPSDARAFTDSRVEGTNYYKIVGHGPRGETVESFPVLVQAEDSVPPTPPHRLSGHIDTTGQVTLRWSASPEKDVRGYRIFRSNHPDQDFIQITREPTTDTTFVDQVSLENLTKDIYYKVSAVDRRFNPSALSEALVLSKPDILPPAAPVFKAAHPRPSGIQLSWIGSPSEDVAHYLLYRRTPDETTWQLAGTTSDTARQFLDQTVMPEQAYEYVLLAVDTSQHESPPTPPLRVTSLIAPRKKIMHTYGEVDQQGHIVVQWDYPSAGVLAYHIYRAEANTALRLYQTVKAPLLRFSDAAVKPAQTYQYRVKAIYTDGSHSPLSDPLQIQY